MKIENMRARGRSAPVNTLGLTIYAVACLSALMDISGSARVSAEQVSWMLDLRAVSGSNSSTSAIAVSAVSETQGYTTRLADSQSWWASAQPLLLQTKPKSKSAAWDVWSLPDSDSRHLSYCTFTQTDRNCTAPWKTDISSTVVDKMSAFDDYLVDVSVDLDGPKLFVHVLMPNNNGIVGRKGQLNLDQNWQDPKMVGVISTFEAKAPASQLLRVLFVLVSTGNGKEKFLRSLKLTYLEQDVDAGLTCELQDLIIPNFLEGYPQRGFGSPQFLILNTSGLHTVTYTQKNSSDPLSTKILSLHTVMTNHPWDNSALLYCVTGSTVYYSIDRQGSLQCYDSSPQCRLPYRLNLPTLKSLGQAFCHPDHGFVAIGVFGSGKNYHHRVIYFSEPVFQQNQDQSFSSRILTSELEILETQIPQSSWSLSFLQPRDPQPCPLCYTSHLAGVIVYDLISGKAVLPMNPYLSITSKSTIDPKNFVAGIEYLSSEQNILQKQQAFLTLPVSDTEWVFSPASTNANFTTGTEYAVSLDLARPKQHILDVRLESTANPNILGVVTSQRWSKASSPNFLSNIDPNYELEDVKLGAPISVVLLKHKVTGLYLIQLHTAIKFSDKTEDPVFTLLTSYRPADPLLPNSAARIAAAAFSPKVLNQTIFPDTREFQIAISAKDKYDSFSVHNFVFQVKSVSGKIHVIGTSQIQKTHLEIALEDVAALKVEMGQLDPSDDTSFLFPLVFYLSNHSLYIRSYRGVRFRFEDVVSYDYFVLQNETSNKPLLCLILVKTDRKIQVLSIDYRRGSNFKPSNKDENLNSSRVIKWGISDSCYRRRLETELRKIENWRPPAIAPLLECKTDHSAVASTCIFAGSSAVSAIIKFDPTHQQATILQMLTFAQLESSDHLQLLAARSEFSKEGDSSVEFISLLRTLSQLNGSWVTNLSLGYFSAAPDNHKSSQECAVQEGYLSGLQSLKSDLKLVRVLQSTFGASHPGWRVSCFYGAQAANSPQTLHVSSGHEIFALRYSTPMNSGDNVIPLDSGLARPHATSNSPNLSPLEQQNITTTQQLVNLLNSTLIIQYPFGVLQRSSVAELIGESALLWLNAKTNPAKIQDKSTSLPWTFLFFGALLTLLLAFGICILRRLRPSKSAQPASDLEEELSLSVDRSGLVNRAGFAPDSDTKLKSG